MARNSEKTVKKIITTTAGLIREKGFVNVTPEMICVEANVSKSTFYYHFNSIEQVINQFYQSIDNYTPESLEWINQGKNNIDKILRCVFGIYKRWFVVGDYDAVVSRWIYCLKDKSMVSAEDYDKGIMVLEKLIAAAKSSGEIFNETDARTLAYTTSNIIDGVFVGWCLLSGRFDCLEATCNAVLSLYNLSERVRKEALEEVLSVEFPAELLM